MNRETPEAATHSEPRIGACVYLLHGLLQRLDQHHPGLIANMIDGAVQDRAAIDPGQSSTAAHGSQILDEALRMLRLMADQLKLPQK